MDGQEPSLLVKAVFRYVVIRQYNEGFSVNSNVKSSEKGDLLASVLYLSITKDDDTERFVVGNNLADCMASCQPITSLFDHE